MSVKIIVTGRPGSVVRREGTMVLALDDNHESSPPRSVPAPPAEPTLYVVYVAPRQWAAIEAALQNRNDVLIVGCPTIGVVRQPKGPVNLRRNR